MKKVKPAAKPGREDAEALVRPETQTGRGKAVPGSAFTRAEPRQSVEEAPVAIQIPRWINAMIARGASYEEVLYRAEERLRRAPTKGNLQLVQALASELSRPERKRGRGLKIRKLVTHARVAPFIKKEG